MKSEVGYAPVEFTVTKAVGYTGNMGGRSWVAEILGADGETGFSRRFLVTRAESEEAKKEMAKVKFRGRKKGSWEESCEVDRPALIEVCDREDRTYYAVVPSMGDPAALGYVPLAPETVIR